MSNINVTIRIDEDLKKQADTLFNDLGFSLSTAFNIFVRQAVREQSIPFLISKNQPHAECNTCEQSVQQHSDEEVLHTLEE